MVAPSLPIACDHLFSENLTHLKEKHDVYGCVYDHHGVLLELLRHFHVPIVLFGLAAPDSHRVDHGLVRVLELVPKELCVGVKVLDIVEIFGTRSYMRH